MRVYTYFFFLTLLCILTDHITAKKLKKREIPLKAIEALPKIKSVFKDVIKLWKYSLKNPDVSVESLLIDSPEDELLDRLKMISSEISTLEEDVKDQARLTILTIHQAFPKILKQELKLDKLTTILNTINYFHDELETYLISGNPNGTLITAQNGGKENQNSSQLMSFHDTESVENFSPLMEHSNYRDFQITRERKRAMHSKRYIQKYTLEDFAAQATGHSSESIRSQLRKLNDLIVDDKNGIFSLMQQATEEAQSTICNLRESPQQTLYNLYVTIALAQLKGNAVLQFSYMLLKMYNKGDFATEADLALKTYKRHTKSELKVIRKVLSETDRSFYKCDPKQYVAGVTYTKLTRLLQGYIENEVNLNPYGTCRENCRYYTFTEYNGCFKEQFCAKQKPCKGKVINCDYVDSDMKICTSTNPERRYEWVQYKRGKNLGNTGVCQNRNLHSVDSWWRWLFWHCSYCLCLCDGGDEPDQESDRYFNLREVTSDIENNKVVTGVRFVKNNRIIHIQIQQGVLIPRGIVNKTSLSWKPVDNYTIYDQDVENNVDYFTMSWLERAIDTDEVFGPAEHAVTGIRFRRIGTHLNLEIRVTPLNFTTGELYTAQHSTWLGNDNTDLSSNNPRTEIKLTEPDIPIRNGPHIVFSKHNQYIQFQASSYKTDVGQSTVPYLDSQAVISEGVPISGIGLIHRGKDGSGGFIAPKLISYDYTPHLRFTESG